MFVKLALLSTLAVVAFAGYHHEPEHHHHAPEQHHVEIHHPQPYAFGYHIKDKHGSKQFREEQGNGHGGVKGSYGYTDHHGIYRKVDYIADKWGFRANVKTNEPGTANQNPADVNLHADPIPIVYHEGHHGHDGVSSGHHFNGGGGHHEGPVVHEGHHGGY